MLNLQPLLQHHGRVLMAIAWLIGNASLVWSQPAGVGRPYSAARTMPGRQVASWPVAPFMTAAREQELIAFLKSSESVFETGEMTLQGIVSVLDQHVPTRIDRRGLEEIGLTTDHPVPTFVVERGSRVGGNLLQSLQTADCTFAIHRGALVITTEARAADDEFIATRIYDVTPIAREWLAEFERLPARQRARSPDLLALAIQSNVRPETWEMLGGPSTMVVHAIGERVLLAISTSTITHFHVQAYLDALNRAAEPEVMGINAAQRAVTKRYGPKAVGG